MSSCRLAGSARIALVTALVLAAPLARAAVPKLETDDQKTFYTMGYTLQGSLDRFAIRPDELDPTTRAPVVDQPVARDPVDPSSELRRRRV